MINVNYNFPFSQKMLTSKKGKQPSFLDINIFRENEKFPTTF